MEQNISIRVLGIPLPKRKELSFNNQGNLFRAKDLTLNSTASVAIATLKK